MPVTHVFLTRPVGRNGEVPGRLQQVGMVVHELPALELRPLPRPASVPQPAGYDLVVFVSRYAAQRYLAWLREQNARFTWPPHTLAATVGATSAQVLHDAGIIPHSSIVHPPHDAQEQDSEALLAVLQARAMVPRRVLIVRGTQGRNWLSQTLAAKGAQVDLLPVYERVATRWTPKQDKAIAFALQTPQHCVFLLTSSEGVQALAAGVRRLGLMAAWSQARFVVLHERIGATLQSVLAPGSGEDARQPSLCRPDHDSIVQVIQAVAKPAAKP